MGIGWGLSAILTATNSLSSDPNSKEFYARTDSRLSVVSNTPVFLFPYPGELLNVCYLLLIVLIAHI